MSEPTTPDTPATPPLDLAALLELAAKATSAPWILDIRVGSVNVFAGEPPDCLLHECPAVIYRKQGEWTDGGWKTDPQAEADAAFIAAARTALPALVQRVQESEAERDKLRAAITEHHAQKADDRCIEDDDRLYAAAGLPPCDRRVGSKEAMLENCKRFIEQRCQGGGWRTYAELEAENARLRAENAESIGIVRKLDAATEEQAVIKLLGDLHEWVRGRGIPRATLRAALEEVKTNG